MCQSCVNEGLLSAEDLTARLARGDTDVIPMVALDFPEFLEAISMCLALEVAGGLPMEEALEAGKEAVDIWIETRKADAITIAALEGL